MPKTSVNYLSGFCLTALLLISCGPKIIPDEISETIDNRLSFEDILKNPKAHLGKTVLLGGEIIETHVLKDGTEIEILQKPLGPGRAPQFTDRSMGRFFLSDITFLDPEIYKSGRRITVVGVVKGSKSKQIGTAEQHYPLLEKTHLYLWPPQSGYASDGSPRISFGFGAIFSD